MRIRANKIKVSPNEMSDYSPREILEKANIDWNNVQSINADSITVSENLAEAWRENIDPEEWESKGPNVDPNLEDDTVAIFPDQITMSGGEETNQNQEQDNKNKEVADEDKGEGDEDSLSLETKLPPENEGHSAGGGMIPGTSARAALQEEARSSNPQTSYSPGKTRDYGFNDWLDFEENVSGSGSGAFLGKPKGQGEDKKKSQD